MVHFVGAGSGAADLITVRGARLLGEADVVIYAGSLVNPALLSYTKPGCEIHNSAKMTLEEVIAVIRAAEAAGKTTVRLHTGDSSIYGAVREQFDELEALGIAYDVCPGVSAFCGAAAALKAEYTLPDVSQTVIITRAAGRTPVPARESIRALAAHRATMVLFLSTSLTEKLQRELLAGGDKRFTEAPIDNYVLKELLFTSGTTGKSKGVMLSADTLLFNIMQSQKLMKITDVCLSVLPYHHSYESTCGLLTMFHHGMTICINESLRSVLPNFKVYKPTEVQLVPLFVEKIYRGIWDKAEETGKAGMLRKLIKVSNAMLKVGIDMRKKLFKSVTSTFGGELLGIICGGAPLKPFLPDFFDSIGITLINGYGISECGPLVSINRPCFHDYESVGLPLPETEIRIDNPNENGEGEICVKGRNVMLGYYKNEAATAEAITDGYFHTGDIGKLGHDGFLFITGRMKNVIILQNGKNVYPEEIEDKLSAMCEYIGEIIIFASKKDENGDQTVLGAEIFPDAERAAARGISDVQEVIKKAISDYNEKEPSYKVIKNIVFRTEEFEKTTSKKIKRKYD